MEALGYEHSLSLGDINEGIQKANQQIQKVRQEFKKLCKMVNDKKLINLGFKP